MAKVAKDSDVHVTFEDQQKINKFARFNARLQDMKEELASKEKELQNLDDAADELCLLDDEPSIPYMIGEVFVHGTVDDTNKLIEANKKSLQEEVAEITAKCQQHKTILSELKVALYAKFGNNINLEAEDD